MKLNYRDKMILIVVFVLLVIAAGFMLFVKPAIDECSQASSDLESYVRLISQHISVGNIINNRNIVE